MMLPFRPTLRRSFLVLTSFSSLLAIALALAVIATFTVGYVERGQTLHIAVGPLFVRDLRDPSEAPAYFVLLEWAGDSVVNIRDFRYARYAIEGAELFIPD